MAELQTAVRKKFQALGMLAWEVNEKTVQAKNLLFPWHGDNETLCELFVGSAIEGRIAVRQPNGCVLFESDSSPMVRSWHGAGVSKQRR